MFVGCTVQALHNISDDIRIEDIILHFAKINLPVKLEEKDWGFICHAVAYVGSMQALQCISSQLFAVVRCSKVLVVVTDNFECWESLISPGAGS